MTAHQPSPFADLVASCPIRRAQELLWSLKISPRLQVTLEGMLASSDLKTQARGVLMVDVRARDKKSGSLFLTDQIRLEFEKASLKSKTKRSRPKKHRRSKPSSVPLAA